MDPFLGEIRIFAGNFAPRSWAFCNGQTMSIAQNTALFSLLGITYGGDGRTTFGLPDLQGRAPMHWGNGTGLTPRNLGDKAGTVSVTLLSAQLASHTHTLNAVSTRGTLPPLSSSPSNNAFSRTADTSVYLNPATNIVQMSPSGTGPTGGNQPHNNMQPYQALSFIISLQGVFPPRP